MTGAARRRVLVALTPREGLVVDVGADHGLVARELGAVATERMPHRRGPEGQPWVVCDGLTAFRSVDVAVIAGMGARSIARILDLGPRPRVAVLHAQDDPPALRRWLATSGWRIDAESLAPEGGGYAEIVRAVAGSELATDVDLDLGPRLLSGDDPLRELHFRRVAARLRHIAAACAGRNPDRLRWATERIERISDALAS